MGLVALQHVGSSQTRAQAHVPCIGMQILNHCATREALTIEFLEFFIYSRYQCFVRYMVRKYLS